MANVPAKRIKVTGTFGSYGEDGATFIPKISSDGTLSWTNNKGLDNPAPIKIIGPKGDPGVPGDTKIPDAAADDEGMVPVVRDSKFILEKVGSETPVFNLVEMGLPAVSLDGSFSELEIDTTEVQTAIAKGPVAFVIPFTIGDISSSITAVVNGVGAEGQYQCITIVPIIYLHAFVLEVYPEGLTAYFVPFSEGIGIPTPTEEDNGKFLRVVDGAWAAVSLTDVSQEGV